MQQIAQTSDEEDDDSYIHLCLALKDGRRMPECTFYKNSALPGYLTKNTAVYLYSPLWFSDKSYGYLAVSYQDDQISYPFHFLSWITTINRVLKNVCDSQHMGILVDRLEDLYLKDSLTGLYNSHGFQECSEALLKSANGKSITCFCLVAQKSREINSNYGRGERNFALQVISHTIENHLPQGAVCSRQNGDEFYVLAPGLSKEESEQFLNNIHKYLDSYNRLHTKPYSIAVNGSFCSHSYTLAPELEYLMNEAERMTQEKSAPPV